jgi:hypothetical protein
MVSVQNATGRPSEAAEATPAPISSDRLAMIFEEHTGHTHTDPHEMSPA